MLERLQIQAIASKLARQDPNVNPAELDEPWRTIYTRIAVEAFPDVESALWVALRGIPDAHARSQVILNAMPAGSEYPSLAQLAADLAPISWLWDNWIPRGMLSLLGASPGAGKSLVGLDLCRRIIHGDSFPDGAAVPEPGRACIYVDAEAIPQLQNQRALAWSMDRHRLYLMLPPDTYGMLDFSDEAHQDRLIDMCSSLQPELLVVDSLSSISVAGENAVEDVRALLGFLSSIAREFECGCLLIHHLRKRQRTPLVDLVTADDFRGSSHIIAMARSVLALSVIHNISDQPNRNGPRRFEVIKTNLCQYPDPLGLHLDPEHPDAPTLRYTDDVPHAQRETTTLDRAIDWLVRFLEDAGQPLAPRDVFEAAEGAGFTDSTIRRARRELADIILDSKGNGDRRNTWRLADNDELDD